MGAASGVALLAAHWPAGPALTTPALWLTGAERGVMLAGLALSLGGLAGRGLSRQYKGSRPGPLPLPWALRGALLGCAASCALLITADAGPVIARQLTQPAPAGLTGGGTALIAAVEAVLFALAALLVRLRRAGWAAAMLAGVVIAEGVRSHPEGVVPVAGAFVAYCHMFPALLWAGMLVYAVRAGVAWRHEPAAARGIVGLYATAAAWLFALVLVTGVISALVLVPVSSLLTTAYGRVLIIKAVVVGIAAVLAMAGRRWLRRPPAAVAGPPATAGTEPGLAGATRAGPAVATKPALAAVVNSGPALATRLEICALAAVLLITGILTVLTPPARPSSAPSGPAAPPGAMVHSVHQPGRLAG